MTHRTRPALTFLMLGLVAFALLHTCAFAAQLPRRRLPELQLPEPVVPAPIARNLDSWPAFVPSVNSVQKEWLLYALRSRRHEEAALVLLVERRGAAFIPNAEDEKELREAGATDLLLEAVRKNYARQMRVGDGGGRGGGMGVGLGWPGGGGPGNNGPVDYTRTFRRNEVTRMAIITSKPEPGYTEEAHKNRAEGVLRLRAVLNRSGEVTDISVVKGLPDGLSEKAIDAARRIKFTPAEKDGHKVSQHVVLEYIFDLPLNEKEVDERAIILEKPEAEYTEEARRNNVRGKVVLDVTLTNFGRVAVNSVKQGLPHGLTEKAVEATQRIVFEPARRNGTTVSQFTTVEYLFGP